MSPVTHYVVDEASASVTFAATSSVHSIRSTGSASGWFEAARDGGVLSDAAGVAGPLEVPLEGFSSGNPLVDREMKRRLGSGANPRIIADLVSAVQTDVGGMTLTGTIGFLGTEVLVEGEVMLRDGARLVGTGGFDVRWWGLEPPRLLMLRVDPIVTVEIDLPLIAQPQPEAT